MEEKEVKKEFDGIIRHFTNGSRPQRQTMVGGRSMSLATALGGFSSYFSRSRLFLFFPFGAILESFVDLKDRPVTSTCKRQLDARFFSRIEKVARSNQLWANEGARKCCFDVCYSLRSTFGPSASAQDGIQEPNVGLMMSIRPTLPFDEMLPADGSTCSAPFLIELSDLMAAFRVWAKLSLIAARWRVAA